MGSVLSRGCCLGSGFKRTQAQLCEWKMVNKESLKVIPGPPFLTASCTPWGESLQQGPGTMGFCFTMDLGSDDPRTMGWNLWNSEFKSTISLWICLCQVNYNNSGKWLNVVSNRRKIPPDAHSICCYLSKVSYLYDLNWHIQRKVLFY